MDINADLGEGAGNDEAIMPLISSCNIACGGHAGDEESIRKTIRLTQQHNVKVGAHPAYPNRKNFGRKRLDISPQDFESSLRGQLQLFQKICSEEGVEIHHIKPHGALYNQGANREDDVEVMLKVFSELLPEMKIYLQDNSLLYQKAKQHFPICLEAFVDRKYADGNSLVNRSHDQALITEPKEAWQQLYDIYKQQEVTDIRGNQHHLKAHTFCIHGDHAASIDILTFIHEQLKVNDIALA
ncbi:MAG: 5-oxoprolinase subunit PxpA [Vicingaceae bacterium]